MRTESQPQLLGNGELGRMLNLHSEKKETLMAFMEPQYRNGKFARIENRYGESRSLPLEDVEPNDFDRRAGEHVAEIEEGWFWRLSADGFMDCTEWTGPFPFLTAAKRDCRDTHEIDPVTGEELPEQE